MDSTFQNLSSHGTSNWHKHSLQLTRQVCDWIFPLINLTPPKTSTHDASNSKILWLNFSLAGKLRANYTDYEKRRGGFTFPPHPLSKLVASGTIVGRSSVLTGLTFSIYAVDPSHMCSFVLTKCVRSSYFTCHPSHGTTSMIPLEWAWILPCQCDQQDKVNW